MQILVFLLGIAVSVISPFKRSSPQRKRQPKMSRLFYKHGFMTDEIDALESILDSQDSHQPPRHK